MVGFPHIVLTLVLVFIPLSCLVNWWRSFKAINEGSPLIGYRNRETVSWGLIDLGVAIFVLAVVVGVGVAMASSVAGIASGADTSALPPAQQSALFFGFGTSTLIATSLIFLWLWARYQRLDGMDLSQFGHDIELGVRWFTMLIVPVTVIQFTLSIWFPSHHPLVEMLKESGDLSFLPVAAFAAVISAPIFEEVLFRLLLQGWMEKLQISRAKTAMGLSSSAERNSVLVGGSIVDSTVEELEPQTEQLDAESQPERPKPGDNPYASPFAKILEEPTASVAGSRPIMWLPILVSSALFALAHWNHGPDWVALFFLAMGLGYLYQRTGRILPSMVVHFLVNALAMLQLWVAVLQP